VHCPRRDGERGHGVGGEFGGVDAPATPSITHADAPTHPDAAANSHTAANPDATANPNAAANPDTAAHSATDALRNDASNGAAERNSGRKRSADRPAKQCRRGG
jgi:hypothetical protein